MASFSLSGSEDDLVDEDDLWELLKELRGQGWRGQVSGVAGAGPEMWTMEAYIDDDSALNGTRSIKASIGDKKVTIGGVISVMSPEAFAATYGGE